MVENKNESIPIIDKALNVEEYSILDWLILQQWLPQEETKKVKKEQQFKS
jgi:hypothetical protein